MTHQLSHWLEKFLVEVVTAVAIAAAYFLLYPAVRGDDSSQAVVFLAAGGLHRVVVFAAGVVALAAVCAVLTIRARPAAAIIATLVGAGAVSVRSPGLRTVLWLQDGGYTGLFAEMILEVVLLGLVLACAAAVAGWVRSAMVRIRPQWGWRPPQAAQTAAQAAKAAPLAGLGHVGQSAVSAIVALSLGIVLVTVLLQSSERGQIIFALLLAFAVAVLLAHRLLPACYTQVYFAVPLGAAILFYALAAVGAYGSSPESWIEVPLYARALPVDWLAAGCGGAAIGLWISQRMNDSRLFEGQPQAR